MKRESRESGAMRPIHVSRDQRLLELAARQHGVVGWRQLRAIGFTREMIRRRIERGRLYRPQPNAYSVLPTLTAPGRMMAAALSCAPDVGLSHRAGAAVWALGPWPTGVVDVSVTRNRAPRPGVRIHVVTALAVVVHDGFPVTCPMRTLADLAATEPAPRVERAYEQADRLNLLDVDELEEECRGRRGSRVLRGLVAESREAPRSKTELERALLDVCRDHGIDLPGLNVVVHGVEVDAFWPPDLVVELDGYEWHRTRKAFENDRRRDALLARHGLGVLRFTWRQLTREAGTVAATIEARRHAAA